MVFGIVTKKMLADWQHAPSLLPHFQFHERHRAVIRTTTPEKILPIVASFALHDDRVISALMAVRQLPQKLRRRPAQINEQPFGLHSFTLLEHSATELCYGLRGQFWRSDFGLETVADAGAYQTALAPGNAKLLLRYQVQPLGGDQFALCTETFIYCPDTTTRLKMGGYWLAIRAGSGWIRQRMLRAVKRQLERSGH